MRRFIQLVFMIACWAISSHGVIAQVVYWNKVFDIGGNSELEPKMTVVDSFAYVLHSYDNPNHNNQYVTGLSKISINGVLQWNKEFAETGSGLFSNMNISQQDSTLFFCLFPYRNAPYDTIHYLVKTDLNGDTLLYKPLYSNRPHRYISSFLHPDGSMILTGYALDSVNREIWVFHKLDGVGETVWYREYTWNSSFNYTNAGNDIELTSDGGYVLGGASTGYDTTKRVQGIIIKTDSIGQIEWVRDIGNRWNEHRLFVGVVDSFILASVRVITDGDDDDPSMGLTRSFIGKYHLDGRVVFEKMIGPELSSWYGIFNIMGLQNGDILIHGSDQDISLWPSGMICRVSGTGDSIWYRYHDFFTGTKQTHKIQAAAELPDGSILTAGQMFPRGIHWDSIPPALWMMRLDSLGCHFPGCDTVCVKPKVEYEIEILPDLRVRAINKTKNALLSFMTLREPDVAWNKSDSFEVTYQMTAPGICGLSIAMEGPCNIPFGFDTSFYVGYVGTPTVDGIVPIQLYPNPATEQCTLQWDSPLPQGTLTLYDLQGKAILRQSIRQSNTTINVSNLAPALYIAAVQDSKGAVVWRGKVMVE